MIFIGKVPAGSQDYLKRECHFQECKTILSKGSNRWSARPSQPFLYLREIQIRSFPAKETGAW